MSHLFKLVFLSIFAFTLAANPAGKETFDGGNYVVEWMIMSASEEIMFNITAKTTGWVGLGISMENKDMKKLDVVVGGVTNDSKSYLWDMYADGIGRPTNDTKQNVEPISASENNGTTMIRFKRKLNTADTDKDAQIKPGDSYYLAWAYHEKVDAVNIATFPKHDKRGYSGQKMLVAGKSTARPPTTTASAFSPTVLLLTVASAVVYALTSM